METRSVVSYKSPLGAPINIVKQTFSSARSKPVKSISFLAGLHGDELDGVYLCCLLLRYLRDLKATKPSAFLGEINIYPAVNPEAICNGSRLWPFFSVDMNRLMGAGKDNSLTVATSQELLADVKANSDLVVDFHASTQHLIELPQIRVIKEFERKLLPLAMQCNMDVIWIHPLAEVLELTLGYNLNRAGISTLVVETGTCLRINQQFCHQVFKGMLNLLQYTGILDEPPSQPVSRPIIVNPSQVGMVMANRSGLFLSRVWVGQQVFKGDKLGELIDPLRGEVLEEVVIPFYGQVFTLRELPLVYEGALLARVALEGEEPR